MLNIGLLTPREVLDAVLSAENIPLNSLEGFVRQIIGWREFVRAAYILKGRRQRTRNYWQHERPLPDVFWKASTGIERSTPSSLGCSTMHTRITSND